MSDQDMPAAKGRSALDGITLTAIDTDPDENLAGHLTNCRLANIDVLAVIPFRFRVTRNGYVTVTYDATEAAKKR